MKPRTAKNVLALCYLLATLLICAGLATTLAAAAWMVAEAHHYAEQFVGWAGVLAVWLFVGLVVLSLLGTVVSSAREQQGKR